MTSAPPATISDATLSQRLRTSRPLRRSVPAPESCSATTAGAISAQRPASHAAIGISKIELASSDTTTDATSSDAKSGATLS